MTTIPASNPPIACTLSAADYKSRAADIAILAGDALIARAEIPGGQRLTFAARDDIEERLRALVAAEAACCAFLTFDLRRAGTTELVLDVTGPPDAQPLVAELFALSAPSSPGPS